MTPVQHQVVEVPITVAGSSLFADRYMGRAAIVLDADRHAVVGAPFVPATGRGASPRGGLTIGSDGTACQSLNHEVCPGRLNPLVFEFDKERRQG